MSSCTAFDLAPITAWVENYFRQRRLREVARQLGEQLQAQLEQLRGLLPDTELFERSLEHVLKRADDFEQAGDMERAVAVLDKEASELRTAIMAITDRMERRIADLQGRFRALPGRASALRAAAARCESFVKAALPADWPAAERERLLVRAREAATLTGPRTVPAADLSAEGVRQLEAAETELHAAEPAQAQAQRDLEKDLADTHKRLLSERLGTGQHRTVTIAEFLAQHPPPTPVPDAEEDRPAAKLDQLLAKIGALRDTAGWADMMRRAAEVRTEATPSRRRSLYENLVIEASRRLKELRAVESWLLGVDELLADAAPFAGTPVDALAAGLRELRRAGRVVDLTPWKAQLAEAIQTARVTMERERRRQAVLASLAELGYETHEGMATALVQAGKLVLHKPGEPDYAVSVVTNRDLSMVQTEVIRYGNTEAATEQERLRDREHEEKWCSEHDHLREKLAKRGLISSVKLRIPPGTKAVRVVRRDQAPAAAPAKAKLKSTRQA